MRGGPAGFLNYFRLYLLGAICLDIRINGNKEGTFCYVNGVRDGNGGEVTTRLPGHVRHRSFAVFFFFLEGGSSFLSSSFLFKPPSLPSVFQPFAGISYLGYGLKCFGIARIYVMDLYLYPLDGKSLWWNFEIATNPFGIHRRKLVLVGKLEGRTHSAGVIVILQKNSALLTSTAAAICICLLLRAQNGMEKHDVNKSYGCKYWE